MVEASPHKQLDASAIQGEVPVDKSQGSSCPGCDTVQPSMTRAWGSFAVENVGAEQSHQV